MADFSIRLRELRMMRGLRQKDLAVALGLAQTTIANYEKKLRFPDENTLGRIADFFQTSLDYLLGRSDVPPGQQEKAARAPEGPAPMPTPTLLTPLGQEYFNRLRNEGRESAFSLVRHALSRGTTVKELYLDVFEPALKEVGRLWALGEMHVGDEHFFTEATQALISQLYPALRAASKPKKGRRCFSFGVCGEFHVIGPRMVADFLEMDGWDTFFLGGNLCAQHALRALGEQPPELLALSVTIPQNVGSARELISSLRESTLLSRVKVIVGGQAFSESPQLWQDIGADAMARNPQEAVDIANRLAAGGATVACRVVDRGHGRFVAAWPIAQGRRKKVSAA